MKRFKFLLLLVISVLGACSVFADVMPYYSSALAKRTIGFLMVPKTFNVHLYPREDSQIVDTVKWTNTEVQFSKSASSQAVIEPENTFAVMISETNQAYCIVIDEQEDWYKVIYDKKNNKTGWVKAQSNEAFWGLRDYVSTYGKQNGLYYMKNIDYRKRGIYSGAYDDAQKLGGFTLIKSIKLHKISGNWALVTVVDFDCKPKIGYIRWREDDGTILAFPRVSQK